MSALSNTSGHTDAMRVVGANELLVIEDDRDTAELFAEVLRDAGFRVDTCHHDALPERNGYAAVLTDLGSGFRSRERARNWVTLLGQRYGTPVIVVSGVMFPGETAPRDVAAADVIQKPVDIDDLVGRVTGVLARQAITA